MKVILHMNNETVAGLLGSPEVYVVAPFLEPLRVPVKRMHLQLKKVGCRSCRGKRTKEEIAKTFLKVTDAFSGALSKARMSSLDTRPLADYLSKASKNEVSGIELDTSAGKQRIDLGAQ